jgi:NCS1 family nucleobase:cation symporter-1
MTPRSAAPDDQVRRYVETHHIDHIPPAARHGKKWQQLFFWAGANFNVFNLVLGGAVVAFVGLTFWWAIIAIVVGALIGGLLIALHATQGPRLGVPQTIQSRGQFGFYGAAFMFPAVLLLNVGFIAAQFVIQAQSLQAVGGSLTVPEWILILVPPAVIIGVFGYRWIHRAVQITTVVVGIGLIIMLIQAVTYGKSLPAAETGLSHTPTPGFFLAGVALLVIDLLSFGPFVSDYTRYLPEDTNATKLFWAIYSGNVIATVAACALGAYLTALFGAASDPITDVGQVSGKWALVIMGLSLIGSDAFCAYTGTFQVLAFANMWRQFKSASAALRIIPFLVVMGVGVVIAILGYKSFVTNLSNLLDVLLAIFIPWSAVNLTDYFFVRRGHYNVASFFVPDSRYGRFAWRGLVAYVIGLVLELPFISQAYWQGWFVKDLGGADISWIVGFVIPAILYLWFAKAWPVEDGTPDLVGGGVRTAAL